VPEIDATVKAGELIENLGNIWHEATPEEKHRLLTIMLEAVYVDLLNTRNIVGILPKPAFYRLFESLKQKPNSKVIIFNPKENAPDSSERLVGLVETGEGRLCAICNPHLLFVLPVVLACNTATVFG